MSKAKTLPAKLQGQHAAKAYIVPQASDSRTCKDAQDEAQLHDNTSPMLLGGV